jgi:hypothetical protein
LLNSLFSYPQAFQILLIFIGLLGVAVIIFAYYNKEKKLDKAKDSRIHPDRGSDGKLSAPGASPDRNPAASSGAAPSPRPPSFAMLKHPRVLSDIFRALLVVLSIVVAAGFALILLPMPAVDSLVESIQSRYHNPPQAKIALLYLGDEVRNGEFLVRGVVRNITAEPIEQLDAAIRFYSHDGSILRTTVIRMNKERIAPDEIARFDLSYRDYKMEFASYAVEFVSRQGGLVPYKDMRTDIQSP